MAWKHGWDMDRWDALSPEAKLFQRAVIEFFQEENSSKKDKGMKSIHHKKG